ncbi:bis(5'-nucleosyl)-tetraphosphatase (symmetrical) YqeK [Spiroplasma clarkii]|uniref:bis(5'-nucleosyl)-tetraphosphatase (symmetrical) YqeK n=1 Tax=Spiroplasma clarkii TaxID=2139 RepID=UPI001C992BCF|nr:bis(5'-nucleosyl)-tetraphosphatase (symmetrical) YqeK [Spiroplasma clarkii]
MSSTKIRNLEDVHLQIKTVNNYINNNLMYIYERLESKMGQERFYHSLNVGQTALNLARLNNFDLNRAMVAGTLHDIAKNWPKEKMQAIIAKYDSNLLTEPEPTWHSFAGAFHLQQDWVFEDEEVITAIYKHTVAAKEMSILDMIVFCADKISVERDYPGVEKYRSITYADLKTGFKTLLKQQYQVAVKKHGNDKIGKQLIAAYKFWIEEDN